MLFLIIGGFIWAELSQASSIYPKYLAGQLPRNQLLSVMGD